MFKKILTGLIICMLSANAEEKMQKKMVIFGSSIASGWVTSRTKQYDMENGWAFRLERLLESQGWQVINAGVPGDNTTTALKRFDKAVVEKKPDIAIISLSLGNEGIGEKEPNELITGFVNNLKVMIEKCQKAGIKPVLGNCYGSNSYTPADFAVIKQANTAIDNLKLPVINLLGTFSDQQGHFPAGHNFDEGHPDNFGHEELFFGVVPGMFDALISGQNQSIEMAQSEFVKIGKKTKINELSFVPTEVCHSFSYGAELADCQDFQLTIQSSAGQNTLSLQNGLLENKQDNILQDKCQLDIDKFKLFITHSYGMEETVIYINGSKKLTLKGKIEPLSFTLSSPKSLGVKNLCFYRGALLQEQIVELENGKLLPASLEFYSPLSNELKNLALSNSVISTNPTETAEKIKVLKDKIAKTDAERSATPVFKDKEAIVLPENELQKFAGKFAGEQCGELLVEYKDGKLILYAFGNQAVMLPESKNKIFLRHPSEITLTYEAGFGSVELNAMGQKFGAVRK